MAVVGMGRYNSSAFDLGVQPDIRIPVSIRPLPHTFRALDNKAVTTTVRPPDTGCLRIVMQRRGKDGLARRISGGCPPNGTLLGRMLTIEARQAGRPVDVAVNYDKAIWSGLSWAVGEIRSDGLADGEPLEIVCRTSEAADVVLTAALYHTTYADARQDSSPPNTPVAGDAR